MFYLHGPSILSNKCTGEHYHCLVGWALHIWYCELSFNVGAGILICIWWFACCSPSPHWAPEQNCWCTCTFFWSKSKRPNTKQVYNKQHSRTSVGFFFIFNACFLCRLSSDLYMIDDSLPFILNILLANFFSLLGIVVVLSYAQVSNVYLLYFLWSNVWSIVKVDLVCYSFMHVHRSSSCFYYCHCGIFSANCRYFPFPISLVMCLSLNF